MRHDLPPVRPSFFQINRAQTERLYAKALDFKPGSLGRRPSWTSTAASARSPWRWPSGPPRSLARKSSPGH